MGYTRSLYQNGFVLVQAFWLQVRFALWFRPGVLFFVRFWFDFNAYTRRQYARPAMPFTQRYTYQPVQQLQNFFHVGSKKKKKSQGREFEKPSRPAAPLNKIPHSVIISYTERGKKRRVSSHFNIFHLYTQWLSHRTILNRLAQSLISDHNYSTPEIPTTWSFFSSSIWSAFWRVPCFRRIHPNHAKAPSKYVYFKISSTNRRVARIPLNKRKKP